MSSDPKFRKSDHIVNDSRNGQAFMNHSGHHNTTVKSKVDFIYGAVPSRSKNDILLVLQSCDYNVDAAISIFSQGRADDVLNQWSHKGKRSKDGNKKKRNKKKQGSMNGQDLESKKEVEKSNGEQLTLHDVKTSLEPNPPVSDTDKPVPTDLRLNTSDKVTPTETVGNGIVTSSSNSSTISEPVTPSEETTQFASKQKDHSSHSASHQHTNKQHHPKAEKLSPSTGLDALKKTTKDLSRSSYSLVRYQLVLEEKHLRRYINVDEPETKNLISKRMMLGHYIQKREECEESFKRITKTFENIKNCISEREAALNNALKEFKEEAARLLQQRLEDAAALKLKTERVPSMSEEQIALLRADIKSFVAERKIDEELAQTKRFICDEESLLQGIKTFGEVVPIKSTYTPVVLNHPSPSQTQKPTPANTRPSIVNYVSDTKPPSTSQPTVAVKNTEPLAVAKNPGNHQPPVVTENLSPVDRHSNTSAAGRPPKIETLISTAMAKSSLAMGNLQDAAEIHSKLKEALKQQGVVSDKEGKIERQSQEQKQEITRPFTALHQPGKEQHRKTQEQKTHRPQSSRQGNRSQQRYNKDETSQTDETRTKPSQRGPSRRNEKRKEGNDESHKSTEGRQSNPPREEETKRPPRRRRRDNKAKPNEGEHSKDAQVASTSKESVPDVKNEQNTCQDSPVGDKSNKEVEKEVDAKNETTAEINSTDGALPQRAPRAQNRKRFRGREKEVKESPEEFGTKQMNGASNGLESNHATNEEDKKEIPEKEGKIEKLASVVTQPVINGHRETEQSAGKSAEKANVKTDDKENIEINGFATSNGNGEDCLVER